MGFEVADTEFITIGSIITIGLLIVVLAAMNLE